MKGRDCIGALRQVFESDLGAHRLCIDLDTLLPDGLRRIIGETLRTLKKSHTDLSLGVSRPTDMNRHCSRTLHLRIDRWQSAQQNRDDGWEFCEPPDVESCSVHLTFPFCFRDAMKVL